MRLGADRCSTLRRRMLVPWTKRRRRGTAQPDSQPDRLLAVPLRAPVGRALQVVATLVVQGDVQALGFRFAAHAQRHDTAGEPQ